MRSKAYLLLDIPEEKRNEIKSRMICAPGITVIDLLDSKPNMLLKIEAPDQRDMLNFAMSAIGVLEQTTQSIKILPISDEGIDPTVYIRVDQTY